MKSCSSLKWGAIRLAPLVLFVLAVNLLMSAVAQGEGRLALSGSFYRQIFEMPQGSVVSGPSIYVVAFNQGDDEFSVKMSAEAPAAVNINLSDDKFTLAPGEQREVLIEVSVTEDAVPGEYEISVSAEGYIEGRSGIQIVGVAGQSTSLVVLGESGRVTVQTLSPSGDQVAAEVRLFKVIGGHNYEFAHSDAGIIESTVSPGCFIASAYVGGEKLAEETFDVAANEEKTVILTVGTVYFEGFGVVPNYDTDTGELVFAEVVSTVRNLYQPVVAAEVILQVTHDGALLEETPLATLSPLNVGRVGLNYSYTPPGAWVNGEYGFRLQLNLDGKSYATTPEQKLIVTVTVGGADSEDWRSAAVVGGIVASAIGVGSTEYLVIKQRNGARTKKSRHAHRRCGVVKKRHL